MDLKKRKYQIIEKLLEVEEEGVIYNIEQVLKDANNFIISKQHKKILDSRLDDYVKDPNIVLDWEQVKDAW